TFTGIDHGPSGGASIAASAEPAASSAASTDAASPGELPSMCAPQPVRKAATPQTVWRCMGAIVTYESATRRDEISKIGLVSRHTASMWCECDSRCHSRLGRGSRNVWQSAWSHVCSTDRAWRNSDEECRQ